MRRTGFRARGGSPSGASPRTNVQSGHRTPVQKGVRFSQARARAVDEVVEAAMDGRLSFLAMEATRTRHAGSVATLLATALLALAPAASAARHVPNVRAFAALWELSSDSVMGARSAWATTT